MDQGKSCAKAERSRLVEAAAAEVPPRRRRRFGKEGNVAPADFGGLSVPRGTLVSNGPLVGAEEFELSFSDEKEYLR